MNRSNRFAALGGLGVAGLLGSGIASAAIDTTDALAQVADAETFVTTVGLAVLGLIFVMKAIKWARRAG